MECFVNGGPFEKTKVQITSYYSFLPSPWVQCLLGPTISHKLYSINLRSPSTLPKNNSYLCQSTGRLLSFWHHGATEQRRRSIFTVEPQQVSARPFCGSPSTDVGKNSVAD